MIATPGPACPPLPVGADECVTASGAPRPDYARTLAAALGVDGTFLVLEDNVRVPSGNAYALVAREATLELARDWITAAGVRSIDGYASRLRRTLERIAPRPWEARIAVLTPGPYNAAFFEHRMLADAIGGVLV